MFVDLSQGQGTQRKSGRSSLDFGGRTDVAELVNLIGRQSFHVVVFANMYTLFNQQIPIPLPHEEKPSHPCLV